jgi:hypothetical protein
MGAWILVATYRTWSDVIVFIAVERDQIRIEMMSYELAHQAYHTKDDVKKRCRAILCSTPKGQLVGPDDFAFLLEVFAFNPEWEQKAAGGITGVTTDSKGLYKTRYFVLTRAGGMINLARDGISVEDAINNMPSSRGNNKMPKHLNDFKKAARNAVKNQIDEYRVRALSDGQTHCRLSSANLATDANPLHVDHADPLTFDKLLYDFCQINELNPLKVELKEIHTVVVIADSFTESEWQKYHLKNANLRLVVRDANLGQPKIKIQWESTFIYTHARLSCVV